MENSYWTIINLLVSCVENSKVDADELKKARFLLSTELDKRSVDNLPIDEIKTPAIGLGWALRQDLRQ